MVRVARLISAVFFVVSVQAFDAKIEGEPDADTTIDRHDVEGGALDPNVEYESDTHRMLSGDPILQVPIIFRAGAHDTISVWKAGSRHQYYKDPQTREWKKRAKNKHHKPKLLRTLGPNEKIKRQTHQGHGYIMRSQDESFGVRVTAWERDEEQKPEDPPDGAPYTWVLDFKNVGKNTIQLHTELPKHHNDPIAARKNEHQSSYTLLTGEEASFDTNVEHPFKIGDSTQETRLKVHMHEPHVLKELPLYEPYYLGHPVSRKRPGPYIPDRGGEL